MERTITTKELNDLKMLLNILKGFDITVIEIPVNQQEKGKVLLVNNWTGESLYQDYDSDIIHLLATSAKSVCSLGFIKTFFDKEECIKNLEILVKTCKVKMPVSNETVDFPTQMLLPHDNVFGFDLNQANAPFLIR